VVKLFFPGKLLYIAGQQRDNMIKMKARQFPIILGIISWIFFLSLGGLFISLAELIFTITLFLALFAAFNDLKTVDFKKIWLRFKRIFRRKNKKTEEASVDISTEVDIPAEVDTSAFAESKIPESSDGLIEIKKDINITDTQTIPVNKNLTVLFIVSFIGIALWRLFKVFNDPPLSDLQDYYYSMLAALLMLIFPFAAFIYLKIRKNNETYSEDKTSNDLFVLFSFVSIIYAGAAAIMVVLDVNFLSLLQWVYYPVTVYIVAALSFNILLSIFKNKVITDFNYTLIPDIFGKNTDNLDEIGLNFSLKSLFTIKYTFKILPGLILALLFIIFLSSSVFVVQPHQRAVICRLGRFDQSSIVGEGIHFKFPWPVDRAEIYDVHRINFMQIGYVSSQTLNNLWGQVHDGGEYLLLLGNGNELVAVNMKINYKIDDLFSYVKTCTKPEDVLSAAAYEALMRRTVNTTLDLFLSVDRSSLSVSIAEELSEFSKREKLGISIVQIIIEGIHPPVSAAEVYQEVVSAAVDKKTINILGVTEAEKIIIDAERQRKTAVDYARARQYTRTSEASKEMAVYYAAMEAHRINPASFELSKYLEVFERVVGSSKVYVFSPGMESSIPRAVLGSNQQIFGTITGGVNE